MGSECLLWIVPNIKKGGLDASRNVLPEYSVMNTTARSGVLYLTKTEGCLNFRFMKLQNANYLYQHIVFMTLHVFSFLTFFWPPLLRPFFHE